MRELSLDLWSQARAPSLDAFQALAASAKAALPAAFRRACADVLVHVQDFPDDDVVREMGLDSPFDLLGLYHGVDLTRASVSDPAPQPDRVFLYRRPILDFWCEGEETLGALIVHVLVHEIGHHFGLSDADMDAIEAAAEAP